MDYSNVPWKPTQKIQDILAGCAGSLNCPSVPKITPGVQIPTVEPADPDLEGEELATWDDEHAMAAEISEAEAFEPRSIADAMKRSDWPLWDKTSGANIIGSKWVLRAKKDAAGNVVRYKACLVAQVPDVDYFDTFAPVARLSSIRAVLAIGAPTKSSTCDNLLASAVLEKCAALSRRYMG